MMRCSELTGNEPLETEDAFKESMAKRTEFSFEQKVQALTMYCMEEPMADIKSKTGMSRYQLYSLLRERDIPIRREVKYVPKLTPEQMQQIGEMYRQGDSGDTIANRLSIARSLVYATLHELGIYLPNNDDGTSRKLTPEQEESVIWLYEQSRLSGPQIARMLHTSVTPIYQTLERANVRRNAWSGPKKHFIKHAMPDGRLCRFQSTWERAFAIHLTERGLEWSHESHTYLLSDGTCYTPDFWVPDWHVFVEVKGLMHEESRRKIELFRSDYPQFRLLVLDRRALEMYGIKQALSA